MPTNEDLKRWYNLNHVNQRKKDFVRYGQDGDIPGVDEDNATKLEFFKKQFGNIDLSSSSYAAFASWRTYAEAQQALGNYDLLVPYQGVMIQVKYDKNATYPITWTSGGNTYGMNADGTDVVEFNSITNEAITSGSAAAGTVLSSDGSGGTTWAGIAAGITFADEQSDGNIVISGVNE